MTLTHEVAAAYGFLLRLLVSSSSRLQVGMALEQFDADEQLPTSQTVTGHESGQNR